MKLGYCSAKRWRSLGPNTYPADVDRVFATWGVAVASWVFRCLGLGQGGSGREKGRPRPPCIISHPSPAAVAGRSWSELIV